MALYFNGNKIIGSDGTCSADRVSLDDTSLAYEAENAQAAFEKITKSLTYAEYEALTDAEKNNGTIYLITDVNGTGDKFQPVIRSLEEREVGVWTDGKPLYEKTIYNAGGTSGVWTFNHNIGNLEMITEANGGCIVHGYSDYSQISWQTLPRTSPDSANIGIVGISNSLVSIYVNDAFGNRVTNIYITLRYTKTTDTAGSGQWTPQGVPAVHYSTDEQVVGTWIDGSTIYEKGLTASGPFGDTFNYIPHGVSNFNQLLDYFGYCTYGSSDKMNIPSLRGSSYVTISSWDATNIRLEKANLSSAISDINIVLRYTKSST